MRAYVAVVRVLVVTPDEYPNPDACTDVMVSLLDEPKLSDGGVYVRDWAFEELRPFQMPRSSSTVWTPVDVPDDYEEGDFLSEENGS